MSINKHVVFKNNEPPFRQKFRSGDLLWDHRPPEKCSKEEFSLAYERFFKLSQWCIQWGKKIELEEVREFANKFYGCLDCIPSKQLRIINHSLHKSLNNSQKIKREIELKKALQELVSTSPTLYYETVDRIANAAIQVERFPEITFDNQ